MDKNQICEEFKEGKSLFTVIGKNRQRILLIFGVLYIVLAALLLISGKWQIGLSFLLFWLWATLYPRVVEERRFVDRNLMIIRKAFRTSRMTEEEFTFQLKGGEIGISREALLQDPRLYFMTKDYFFVLFRELQLYLPIAIDEFDSTDQLLTLTKKQKRQILKRRGKKLLTNGKAKINFRQLNTITESDQRSLLANFGIWFLIVSTFLLSCYWYWCHMKDNPQQVQFLPIVGIWFLSFWYAWFSSVSSNLSYRRLLGFSRLFRPFTGIFLAGNQLTLQFQEGWGRFDLAQTIVSYEKAAGVIAIYLAGEYLYGSGVLADEKIRYRKIIIHQQTAHFFGCGKSWRKLFFWLVIYASIVSALMLDLIGYIFWYF